MRVIEAGLDDPQVIAMLGIHLDSARAATAPGSAHALDLAGLRTPDIRFWSAWDGDSLHAVGALRRFTPAAGEVKSMHTAASARRGRAGTAILERIITAARTDRLQRLYLETGSWDYFHPAHAFYRRHGFTDCVPFGSYLPDPNSLFMTLDLDSPP